MATAYHSALFRIDWMVILEIMPAMVGIAASASLLMLLDTQLELGMFATHHFASSFHSDAIRK